ncbi:MAG: ComF family protein [Geobacteraceae bacterium]|nr:ComF family protein [Geobacteraceae bacterium]NTW78602.1 ComF family protein [Geobacteraceae bacterium]
MFSVKQLFHALLDVFLPPLCHICHSFIPNAGRLHICQTCRDSLPLVSSPLCPVCGIPFIGTGGDHRCSACLRNPPHFDAARAHFLYEGPIRDLIHSFKYNRKTHLRNPLALLALEGMNLFLADKNLHLIVPVPLHRSRLQQRGFNQAVLLGKTISRQLSLPITPNALIRSRPTEPQIDLTAAQRRVNVKGAFTVSKPDQVVGKRILLLDDVMTTGSTMDECAKELKKAGADVVIAATIARTAQT